jgi:hypothetical protein
MVHALEEAWRILVTCGLLIDLRPIGVNAPLEVVFPGGCELAGQVDLSPGHPAVMDADKAIRTALERGIFSEIDRDYFDYAYYWKTARDVIEDMDERWTGDAILPDEVIRKAGVFMKKHQKKQPQVRMRVHERLVKYEKS